MHGQCPFIASHYCCQRTQCAVVYIKIAHKYQYEGEKAGLI